MPLYDYKCTECGTNFEANRRIADREASDCPHCGGLGAQQISAPLVSLDGTDPSFPGAYNAWAKKRKTTLAHK